MRKLPPGYTLIRQGEYRPAGCPPQGSVWAIGPGGVATTVFTTEEDAVEAAWRLKERMEAPLMLDLCSGLGGASEPMRARGWQVVTVDIDERFNPAIVADLREWEWRGRAPDLIWLSDPCTEFSRESMPWCRTGRAPDLSIALAGLRVIQAAKPRYWVRENVRGSMRWVRPFLGSPREIHGPFYLWGNFPPLGTPRLNMRKKEAYSSAQAAERARIPYALSEALALAVESQEVLVLP